MRLVPMVASVVALANWAGLTSPALYPEGGSANMKRTLFPLASARSVVVLLGALLLGLTLVVLASALAPNSANAATTVVTKTFSNQGQILIPSGAVVGNCSGGSSGPGTAAPY